MLPFMPVDTQGSFTLYFPLTARGSYRFNFAIEEREGI